MSDLPGVDLNLVVDEHMIPPMEYEPSFNYRNVEIAQTNALRRLVYTDTDSSFTDTLYILTYIIYSKYKIQPKDLLAKLKVFDDDAFEDVALSREEVIKIIQRIASNLESLINDNVLIKFGRLNGVKDEYNKLAFEQEYIFSAIYLNADKNYMYRAIAEKGVISDIFDTLNIGQKSDKSQATNEVLKFLGKTMLIEGVDKSIMYAKYYIDKFKQKILERDRSIAVPASISKTFDEYGKVTQSVRAALIYEILTDNEGRFTPGSKGSMYFVSQFHWENIPNYEQKIKRIEKEFYTRWKITDVRNRLDVILIHEEDVELFDYNMFSIHEDAQLVRVLLKPLNQLYAPLGIDIGDIAGIGKNKLK